MRPVHARLRGLASKRLSRKIMNKAEELVVLTSGFSGPDRLKRCARECAGVVKAVAATGLLFAFVCGILTAAERPAKGAFQLQSTAFGEGGFIPQKYTCSGENVSPALSWTDVPAGTKSLVLIVSDPDAPSGTWIHWIVYDLPASIRRLPEGLPKAGDIEGGGRQGTSSFQEVGYGGPCPPPGDAHHYHFTLFALNARLGLQAGATREQVDRAMKGRVIAKAELVGLYKR
jgi:Raf kinase inhibitor-like YbhB/YbcL family protein